jgi:6-phosphofructokinase 2
MIVTLTLNPAIDKSTEIAHLVPEKKLRCADVLIHAGGGGINVSKALDELGGKSIAVFPYGGVNGQLLLSLVQKESVTAKAIEVKGETRENFVVTELSSNKQYRFVMPGASLSEDELQTIKSTIESRSDISFLVCSGSLPKGVAGTYLGEIAHIARRKNIKFVIDTSGAPLKAAMEKGVYLVKPNLTELCSLVGKDYLQPAEIDEAAKEVIRSGRCEVLVVSMGPTGAMLVTENEVRKFKAPVVKKQTTVGAGDSMVAGVVYSLEQGKSLEEAIQFGIACGTAATINKGTQLFSREDVDKLYDWMLKNN